MAQRTIMRLYDGYDTVVEIVHRLELAGVPDRDISVINSNVDSRYPVLAEAAQGSSSPVRTGLLLGGAIGGCFGALAGIGAISLPALQPVVDIGWFPAVVAGAVVGGAIGTAIGLMGRVFARRNPALAYAEGIRRGNTLLTVRVDEELVPRVEMLMGIRGQAVQPPAPLPATVADGASLVAPRPAVGYPAGRAVPLPEPPEGYGGGGWSRFEPTATVTPADLDAERRRIDAANQRIQNE
jgi:hypothetical protein